jgi:type IX secretion system PorP/SprF family membrane protein
MSTSLKIILAFSTFLFPGLLKGQDADVHFSQFFHSPLFLNPALTGAEDADLRFAAVHRRQWQSVPVPYLTFAAAGDARLPLTIADRAAISVGLTLVHDEAGDGNLSLTALSANVSARVELSRHHALSVGFALGGGQRGVDPGRLQWGSQFDGEIFNPGQIPGEQVEHLTRGFADLSGGLNWQVTPSDDIRFDIGAGVFHVNRPDISFLGLERQPWAMRISAYAMGTARLSGPLLLRAHSMVQVQGTKREILIGSGLIMELDARPGSGLAIGGHMTVRVGDAIIPTLEIRYGPWTAGVSFDINTSGFRTATAQRGGPELVLIHTIQPVRPPGIFESCPIY